MSTIRSLNIFIEVYRNRSISKAAENLYLTQPAVSRSIADLEKEYETQLFERYHRHLLPTDAAERLYAHALQVTSSYEEMEKSMKEEKDTSSIRIGSTMTIGSRFLPSFIKEFQSKSENTELYLNIANGTSIQSKLLNNQLDIALIEDAIHEEDLTVIPFQKDRLTLILPLDHPLSKKKTVDLKDLTEYPILLREKGSAAREYLDHVFSAADIQIRPFMESAGSEAIIEAVKENLGISILPHALVEKELEAKTITTAKIRNVSLERTWYIVHHRQKYLTPVLQNFIDAVMNF